MPDHNSQRTNKTGTQTTKLLQKNVGLISI